jgi:hypothetical protein
MRLAPIIASLGIATGIGIAIFWLFFFTVGIAPTHPPPGYFAFEYSFVLSDIVLALSLLIAGTFLFQQQPFGRNLSGRGLPKYCLSSETRGARLLAQVKPEGEGLSHAISAYYVAG